jgi:hypothetical protein
MIRTLGAMVLVGVLFWPVLLEAQAPGRAGGSAARSGEGWNDARVSSLVLRGQSRRAEPLAGPALESYRAHAEGTIYFYIDPDEGEPVLMRADQVAVELYWAAPNRTRQVLVGQRIEKRLPIRDFHYYMDRLTVVQNGFGDEIRVGEGMDVRDVLHPLAQGAERVYDFRLADSLTLRLPGSPPIRALEVVVRPRDMSSPGFVGSIFLEEATGALVRMSFGFTRASYVDPRNDYVQISVDHGLWQGRFWLPNEQQVIVRREIPELDLRAGTIIRATLRVTDYDFDASLPDEFFRWPTVTAVPREQRARFAFERGMYDDLTAAGLAPGRGLREVEAEARRLAMSQLASGLPVARLAVPAVSELVRFNRAEGLFLGAGARAGSAARELRLHAGRAFGPGENSFRVAASERVVPGGRLHVEAFLGTMRDVGPPAPLPAALNSISAAFGRDYLDPYRVDGVTLGFERAAAGGVVGLSGSVEQHRSARHAVGSAPFGGGLLRAVRPVGEGVRHALRASWERRAPAYQGQAIGGTISVEAGDWRNTGFMLSGGAIEAVRRSGGLDAETRFRLSGGIAYGAAPAQHHAFLGGVGTLPGQPYRAWSGRHFLLAEAATTRELARPWAALRLFAAAGATFDPEPTVAALWNTPASGGVRGSIGAGVSLLHGIIRVDLAHGVNGGGPALLFSVDPRLHPWM